MNEIDCEKTKEAKCIGPQEGEHLMMQKVLANKLLNPQKT